MSETSNQKPITIEKEEISNLKFHNKTKVPQQEQNIVKRLIEATSLGNIDHGKVTIVFEDDENVKQVFTTIWCTGNDYICLKGGVWLPINRIHKIIF